MPWRVRLGLFYQAGHRSILFLMTAERARVRDKESATYHLPV